MLVHGLGTVIGLEVISRGKLVVYQHVTLGEATAGRGGLMKTGKSGDSLCLKTTAPYTQEPPL